MFPFNCEENFKLIFKKSQVGGIGCALLMAVNASEQRGRGRGFKPETKQVTLAIWLSTRETQKEVFRTLFQLASFCFVLSRGKDKSCRYGNIREDMPAETAD